MLAAWKLAVNALPRKVTVLPSSIAAAEFLSFAPATVMVTLRVVSSAFSTAVTVTARRLSSSSSSFIMVLLNTISDAVMLSMFSSPITLSGTVTVSSSTVILLGSNIVRLSSIGTLTEAEACSFSMAAGFMPIMPST